MAFFPAVIGAGTKRLATIDLTYPKGSTVVCTGLSSGLVINAIDISSETDAVSHSIIQVPSLETYRCSATDGVHFGTAIEEVVLENEGETVSSTILGYTFVVYDDGSLDSHFGTFHDTSLSPKYDNDTTNKRLWATGPGTFGKSSAGIVLGNYKCAHVIGNRKGGGQQSANPQAGFSTSSQSSMSNNYYAALNTRDDNDEGVWGVHKITFPVAISKTETYYFSMSAAGTATNPVTGHVKKLVLYSWDNPLA